MNKKNTNNHNSLLDSLEKIEEDSENGSTSEIKIDVKKVVKQPLKKEINKPQEFEKTVVIKKEEIKEIKKTEEKSIPEMNKMKENPTEKKANAKEPKKKHNYILWAGLIVVLIPCFIVLYIILGSRENSGEPIEGSRFNHSLDPAISDVQQTELKDALVIDGVESIEVTLKSATLRVNINTVDDASEESVRSILNSAYEAVIAKFPIDTYFTNKTEGESITKMYDLQVSAYNFIPEGDEDKSSQIQIVRTKNSAAESDVIDIVSSPKNEAAANEILNPDTTTIPNDEPVEE